MKNKEILQLVNEIKQGNRKAENKLYTKIYPFINLLCNNFVKNKEEVEDLTSESLIKIFQNINDYNTEYTFLTWAGSIARNNCLNFLRSKSYKINQLTNNDDISMFETSTLFEIPNILKDDIFKKDVNERFGSYDIQRCLNKLKPIEKQVVNLVYFQGYKVKELDDIFTDLDSRNIRLILFRAKKKIKYNLLQLEENKNNNKKVFI
jgi:RNA polymerase sigma factor (sigma-70 family)